MMLKTFLSLLVYPFRSPVISLVLTISSIAGMYGYSVVKTATLERDLHEAKMTIAYKQIELEATIAAQKSCEASVDQLVRSSRKKHAVIKEYEKNIHAGEKDAIHNLDDFIDFAHRMQ